LHDRGVTIFFVSHSADMVQSVCSRAIWLDQGKIMVSGTAEAVVARYLDHTWQKEEGTLKSPDSDEPRRWGSGELEITKVRLLECNGQERQLFRTGGSLTVEIHYRAERRTKHPVFGLAIHSGDGAHVTGPNTQVAGHVIPWLEGEGVIRYTVSNLPLLEGSYYVTVAVHDQEEKIMYDYHERMYPFRILPSLKRERYGIVTLKGKWTWNGQGGESWPLSSVKHLND